MMFELEKSWANELAAEFDKPYFIELMNFLKSEYAGGERIFPEIQNVFRSLNLTPIDKVSVVILGQDPYHGMGQANGLCFSVNDGVKFPPSLKNIYTELKNDLGIIKQDGDLSAWANRGALLLNSVLTVRENNPASHAGRGWEKFTNAVINALSKREKIVYILWGAYAIKKADIIDRNKNLVLSSVHPSPLSAHRGFFGNNHFSAANEYLIKNGKTPVFL